MVGAGAGSVVSGVVARGPSPGRDGVLCTWVVNVGLPVMRAIGRTADWMLRGVVAKFEEERRSREVGDGEGGAGVAIGHRDRVGEVRVG